MELAQYKGVGAFDETVRQITKGIENSAITAELLQSARHTIGGQKVALLGFEKYFYRSGNRGTLTIMVAEDEFNNIFVDVISGGTSQGVFFKFDWGASKSFVKTIDVVMNDIGFERIY